MSWTKLSDNWTDRADLAELSFEDRWHYLALIQLCSRSGRFDGLMRAVDARRCSDHSDPESAIKRLVAAGLLERVEKDFRLVEVEEHVPPPSVRNKTERDKYRKRRERAHKAGEHSMCLPEHCPLAPVTPNVTRDPGTGQDGPGLSDSPSATQLEVDEQRSSRATAVSVGSWPVAEIPKASSRPDRVSAWVESGEAS